jgi:hypothetical protein
VEYNASVDWEDWDGILFHVSSVLNRESIEEHGLDWSRMGAAPGIAGNRTPEVEGCFVGQDERDADFFVGFDANPVVDIWRIEGIRWTKLIQSAEGFWYYPGLVPPSMLTLHRRDVRTRDDLG